MTAGKNSGTDIPERLYNHNHRRLPLGIGISLEGELCQSVLAHSYEGPEFA
jgi:hypothetical protein